MKRRYDGAAVACLVFCAAVAAYVLSYPPLMRANYATDGKLKLEKWDVAFKPVHAIIDHTPLHDSMIKWGGMWRVGRRMAYESQARQQILWAG